MYVRRHTHFLTLQKVLELILGIFLDCFKDFTEDWEGKGKRWKGMAVEEKITERRGKETGSVGRGGNENA